MKDTTRGPARKRVTRARPGATRKARTGAGGKVPARMERTGTAKGSLRGRVVAAPAVHTDAVRVVSSALDERLGVVILRLREARVRATEPAIHDLRVALRRLIAVLDLASEVVPGDGIPALRRKLRKILKGFNAVRDVHISLLAMGAMQRSVPAVRAYLGGLRRREATLLRECGGALRAFDVRSIERSVATVQQSLFAAAADPAIAAAMTAVVRGSMARTYVRALRALRNVNAADAATVHTLRVSFKKVRYAVEVLAPLTGGFPKPLKKWMGEYQTLMGEVQDCEVMIAGVRRFAATPVAGRRVPMIAVQEALALRKSNALAQFLRRAGELETKVSALLVAER